MPLFVHANTHIITYRKFEYNTEYLDGILDLIEDTTKCNIVTHHPNRRFGYDIGVIKEVDAKSGWEKVNELGHFDEKQPAKIYYELVPVDKYEKYINSNKNFYTIKEFKQEKEVPEEKTLALKETFDLPTKSKQQKPHNIEQVPSEPKPSPTILSNDPKLVRSNEHALYKYKQPNIRYGG